MAAQDAGVVDAGSDDGGASDAGEVDAGAADPWPRLLHAEGTQLVTRDGGAVDFRGAISCCGGAYGWPLFDEAWLALSAAKDVTFLHARLGPFLTVGNGETDWAGVGGGYVETGGKADLSQFNEAFWARVRSLISQARDLGMTVEVDVVDGWAVKHCRWGDIPGYSAWESAFNVQGNDLCASAGSGAVTAGSEHERWIRKVVFETGRFDNVIYQDGNEVGLIAGYSEAWTKSMHDVIRDEEAKHGYPRHLFGTNSGRAAAMQLPEVDFVELHQNQPATSAQCEGKPCLVNEYNPNPSLTPETLAQRYCTAKQQGTYFWYWRHGQSAGDMDDTLSRIAAGCP